MTEEMFLYKQIVQIRDIFSYLVEKIEVNTGGSESSAGKISYKRLLIYKSS